MNINQIAHQFAQALANGDLSLNDLGYVLEHVDDFIKDNNPLEGVWIHTNFENVATEIYKAQRICEEVEE
jgi:hypothetical protein